MTKSTTYKRLSMMVVMLLVAMSLGACSSATNTPAAAVATTAPAGAATTAPAGAATTAASTGGTTVPKVTGKVVLWHAYGSGGSGEAVALKKAIDEFTKDNPGASVEALDVPFDQLFNKFKTEAAAGGGPDLFVAPNDSYGDLVRANLLAPVDDKIKPYLESFTPIVVEGSKVDGKYYGVPGTPKAVAMFYNKDKVKTPPKTTDEMLAAQKAGIKFGFNNGIYHEFGLTGGYGGKLLDASGKCIADAGGFSDAFKFMQDMKTAGAQLNSDGDKAGQQFANGQVDAIIEGPWKTADFKKGLADKLGVAPIPAGPKGAANPLTGVDMYYINASGKNVANTTNFALYMATTPKIVQFFVDAGQVSWLKAVKDTDPVNQAFAQAVATGYPRPQVAELANFWSNFGDGYTKATETGADPVKSVADACAAMNKANKK